MSKRTAPQEPSDAPVAFAFDIDGVLVHGKNPIPGARETLLTLREKGIPYIFLTNSGGVTEQQNVNKLASRLGRITFDKSIIVQSHTPFHDLVPTYQDKTILALGGHGSSIRDLAHAYGFRNVVTSSDIMLRNKSVHPFPEMTESHHKRHAKQPENEEPLKIDAIMVFSSPRDWCLDLQVTLDLLLSCQGVVGTRSEKNGNMELPNNGFLEDGQPQLYFCNPDFEWSTSYELPRLAQGAFLEALRGLWNATTKAAVRPLLGFWTDTKGAAQLYYHICGKPTFETYQYGERALQKLVSDNPELYGPQPRTVYMIGDNPASDIAGANAVEAKGSFHWKSVLVETGVYKSGTHPAHIPDHVAKDVKEAVEWAITDAQA